MIAQDIHFSQFIYSPLNLNPARTGMFDGDYRFVGNHRNQWNSVTVPYKTFSASFDMNVKMYGQSRLTGGIVLNSDKAGDSEFGTLQGLLSSSYIFMIDTASTHAVSFGLQAGLVQRSIIYSKLTFDEQFNGDIYVPNSATGETFDDSKFIYPDVNAGAVWIKEVMNGFYLSSGVSVHHLNAPRQSFYSGEKVPLKRRIAAHIQSDIKVHERTALLPSFLYMKQGAFSEFVLGGSVKYALSNKPGKEVALHLGAFGRIEDAFILHIGTDYNNWFGGFSYDINTSGLKPASDGRGGPEFSIIYRIKKVKPLPYHPPCPVY